MRRRVGIGIVALAVVEIVLLVLAVKWLGLALAVLLVLLTTLLGAWRLRREGTRAWRALRTASAAGRPVGAEVGDDVLQLRDGAPLEQHVPVGAWRLGLLLLGFAAVDQPRDRTVELAFPGDRDLGVDGEGYLELVAPGAQVLARLPRSQLGVAVGLVADGSEAASAQHALAHDRNSPSGAWSVLRCNEAISLTIPDAIGQTTSLPPSRVAGVWPQRPPPMPRWDATTDLFDASEY